MAAIVSVTNGQAEDEDHFNQYADALSNVLGITDTTQDALGRLVLPRSSAAPGSPSAGELYYDTDDDWPSYYDGAAWRQMQALFLIWGAQATTPGQTDFLVPGSNYLSHYNNDTSAHGANVVTRAGRVRNFRVSGSNSLTTAIATYTVRKNQVDQALVVVLQPGVDAGEDLDASHGFDVVAGDRISLRVVAAAGGSGSIEEQAVSVELI